MIKTYIGLHVNYPLFFSDFNETEIFSTDFPNNQISNIMIILPVGADLFHADRRSDGGRDGRTDMTKLIIAFRNFVNAPEKSSLLMKFLCPNAIPFKVISI
jgi:hypothetical protein